MFMNESLQLMNIKFQLNNLNIQFDNFMSQVQNNLVPNIGTQIEDISLKLLNLGIEMLNIELKSNNTMMFNSIPQIKNVGDMIQNVALQMTNMNSMKINNFNIGMPLSNFMPNQNFPNNIPKFIVVTFKTTKGKYIQMKFSYGTTIKQMIDNFYIELKIPLHKRLTFLYNAIIISPNDMTVIEKYFQFSNNPRVLVNDPDNLIGG